MANDQAEKDTETEKPDPVAKLAEMVERQTDMFANAFAAQAESKATTEEKQAEKPKTYTRRELDALRDQGTISAEQADAIYEKQIQDTAAARAEQIVRDEMNMSQLSARVTGELDRYRAAIPEILKNGSPERTRLQKAWDGLRANGSPSNRATEVAALQIAFGPIEAVEAARRPADHETHEDVSAGARAVDQHNSGVPAAPRGLPSNLAKHYQRLIDTTRIYPGGWNDPGLQAEIKPYVKGRK